MSDDLRRAAVDSLTPAGQALLDEIENFAGFPIDFAPYNFAPPRGTSNPLAAAAEISHDSTAIYIHGTEPMHLFGIPHELLHVRRHFCDGVPQLHPKTNKAHLLELCGRVTNVLEHLHIVPLEATYGADNTAYWESTARKKWASHPWKHIPDVEGRRGNALLGRLENELVSNPEIIEMAARVFAAEGVTDEAKKFADRINELRDNPPRSFACAVRFLKWPRDKLQLVYFDPQRRRRRSVLALSSFRDCGNI